MSAPEKVNLEEKFGLFTDRWSPKIVGELNGQQVKLAKISGEFVWHAHEHEDELFLVVKGVLRMRLREPEPTVGVLFLTTHGVLDTQLREREVVVSEGEFIIVPRGVEHQPVADTEEVWMLLFEPASTVNTGTAGGERTVTELERL